MSDMMPLLGGDPQARGNVQGGTMQECGRNQEGPAQQGLEVQVPAMCGGTRRGGVQIRALLQHVRCNAMQNDNPNPLHPRGADGIRERKCRHRDGILVGKATAARANACPSAWRAATKIVLIVWRAITFYE